MSAAPRLAGWRRDGWEASLWLRCPAAQLMAPFGASVLEALADSGLAPAALILEVPPEVLGEGGDAVLRGLGELRERGVRLAVDISAAGYGSLARLSHHPVDLVRIGPDLVAGLGVDAAAETLIKALVRVGRDLGIPVAADGIERAEQRDLLAAMGCILGPRPLRCRARAAGQSPWPGRWPGSGRRDGGRAGAGRGDSRRTRARSGGSGSTPGGSAWPVSGAGWQGRAGSCRSATSSRPPLISPAETNARSS